MQQHSNTFLYYLEGEDEGEDEGEGKGEGEREGEFLPVVFIVSVLGLLGYFCVDPICLLKNGF